MHQPCFITAVTFHRAPVLDKAPAAEIVLNNLDFYRNKHGYHLCGFVIMPDHMHFLIIVNPANLSGVLRDLKSMMARQLIDSWKTQARLSQHLDLLRLPNSGRAGHTWSLWQPGSWPVQLETAADIERRLDYMHLNPVRAAMCERAVDWPLSSARWYLRNESVGIRIDTEWAS